MSAAACGAGASPKVTPVAERTRFLVGVGLKFPLPRCVSAEGLSAPRDPFHCSRANDKEFSLGCVELERKTSKWVIKIKKLLVNAGTLSWTARVIQPNVSTVLRLKSPELLAGH